MKCRNCGATYSGITCPLCGHRQLKKAECSVCFTTLFPGQEYCPKCGSPTLYRKADTVKKITPDTIVHSSDSHNYNTVSQSYNYQADAYDYNENNKKKTTYKKPDIMSFASIFEPLKNNMRSNRSYHSPAITKKKKIMPISLIVLSIFLIMAITSAVAFVEFMDFNEKTSSVSESRDYGNVELSHFTFDRNTTQSEYNQGLIGKGLSFVYNHQLYIGDYEGIKVYESKQDPYVLVDDYDCSYLYVNESGVYYNSDNKYIRYSQGEKTILLEDAWQCYQVDHYVVYLTDDNEVWLYDIDTKYDKKLYEDIDTFTVDDINLRIMVFDHNGKGTLIDFTGQVLKNNFDGTFGYGSFFINGELYYRYDEGIYCQNVMNGEKRNVYPELDCYRFALAENGGVYTIDYNDYLSFVYLDGDDYVYIDIFEDIDGFNLFGNEAVFYIYDDDYNRLFYICDNEGNYSLLQ